MEWTQTYPGLPAMVPAIRAFVRAFLLDSPRREDAELVISELAANSLRHTPSGAAGGELAVTVAFRPGWARVAVSDAGGGEWSLPAMAADDDAEGGRGLLIAEQCADKIGHEAAEAGQTMWAEFLWA